MKRELFAELVESVEKMRAIQRDQRKPTRVTAVEPAHAQAIRRRLA